MVVDAYASVANQTFRSRELGKVNVITKFWYGPIGSGPVAGELHLVREQSVIGRTLYGTGRRPRCLTVDESVKRSVIGLI